MADPIVPTVPAVSPNGRPAPASFTRTVTGPTQTVVPGSPGAPVRREVMASAVPETTPAPAGGLPAPVQPPKPGESVAQRVQSLQRRERQMQQWRASEARRLQGQEAQLRDLQSKLTQQQADLKKQVDDLTAERAKFSGARNDPLKWLESAGFTPDQVAAALMDGGKIPAEQLVERVRGELQSKFDTDLKAAKDEFANQFKQEQEARTRLEEAEKQRIQQEEEATVRSFHAQTVDFVNQNPDRYELTCLYKQQGEVPKLIEQYYKATLQQDIHKAKIEGRQAVGKVLTRQEAADFVENQLEEDVKLLPKSKKMAALLKLAAGQTPEVSPQETPQPIVPKSPVSAPTLTNEMAATPPSHAPNGGPALSDQERYRRALAHLNAPGAVRQGKLS